MSKPVTSAILISLMTCSPLHADAASQPADELLREEARNWLKQNTDYISCDDRHFVYGVGYIDGSYMERIFYVEGGSEKPAMSVRFKDTRTVEVLPETDIEAIPFVLEMVSPRVLHALPDGDGWRLGESGWETALRFKYTSWFGTISRHDGKWEIEWQGYRRPMLPPSAMEQSEQICRMFEGQ